TPSNINASFDNPALPNVTFEYNGPVDAPGSTTTFSGFTIVSTLGSTQNGKYASQATNNIGATAGQTDQAVGPVLTPVPEPSALVLLGVGLSAIVTCPLGRRFFRGAK